MEVLHCKVTSETLSIALHGVHVLWRLRFCDEHDLQCIRELQHGTCKHAHPLPYMQAYAPR